MARQANPANVGGASSGALQARGRQGNPGVTVYKTAYTVRGSEGRDPIKWTAETWFDGHHWRVTLFRNGKLWADEIDPDDVVGAIKAEGGRDSKIAGRIAAKLLAPPRTKNPGRYVHGGPIIHDFPDWNLDALSAQELIDFGEKVQLKKADIGVKTANHLTKYARTKARAMKLREAGHINDAVALENQCDRIYKQLPKWAKW